MPDDRRLTKLEETVAYQDRTIHELNEVVTRQQDQIDWLIENVKQVLERQTPLVRDARDEEPPPHY